MALITPYHEDLSIDWRAFEKYVDDLCHEGVHGLVPCGTTGEFLALTPEEHRLLIRHTVKVARGRAKVIAGAGGFTCERTLPFIQAAQEEGADGVLIITPPYIKPSQEGLFEYYHSLLESLPFPIVLYHNPSRASVGLEISTILRLAELPHIIGLKDACPDLSRPLALRALGETFALLSGEDATLLPFLAAGGSGTISASANITPRLCVDLWQAWTQSDIPRTQDLASKFLKVSHLLFQSTSPGPLKYACALRGWGTPYTRLPLGPLSFAHQEAIRSMVQEFYPIGC